MWLCLDAVLDRAALDAVRGALAGAAFMDGASSAGWHARGVKHNEQLVHDTAGALITQALQGHALFQSAALPARLRAPLFSRYRAGMGYGTHVDDALMGTPPLRTDLALTLFLSDPADYDGGDLVIESAGGEQAFRLAAGSAVLYPATTLHRVEPVTRGERLAAVLWVQSQVRQAWQREVLFDLDQLRRGAWAQDAPRSEFNLLAKTYANLLRAWAEN